MVHQRFPTALTQATLPLRDACCTLGTYLLQHFAEIAIEKVQSLMAKRLISFPDLG